MPVDEWEWEKEEDEDEDKACQWPNKFRDAQPFCTNEQEQPHTTDYS